MSTEPTYPALDDARLHAWVDGRLDAHEARAFEAELARQPERAETAHAWKRQREALRGLTGLAQEPPSPELVAAARRADAALDGRARLWRLGGVAAGLLLAFGLGWGLRSVNMEGLASGWAGAPPAQQFARQAALAHAVYQPEQRHPVEVGADQEAHLVQWLSKRLGRPIRLPQLEAQGYALVGGRLLPGDAGARAQFMFQNGQGQRITLYLGALEGAGAGETAFRYHADGPVPAFYWVDQGFGYAISGPLPRDALLSLATTIYRQL